MKKVVQTIVNWSFPLAPSDDDHRVFIATSQLNPEERKRIIGELTISSLVGLKNRPAREVKVTMEGIYEGGEEILSSGFLGDESGPFCFKDFLEQDERGHYSAKLIAGEQFTDGAIRIATKIMEAFQVYENNKFVSLNSILGGFTIIQKTWVWMKVADPDVVPGGTYKAWRPLEEFVRERHGLVA